MKALFVFEYGPTLEYMMGDLMRSLERQVPGLRTHWFHGWLRTYIVGGTRPKRVLNALYMFVALPFVMLARRPDVVLVRTTPPGIQLWGCLLGRLMGARVGTWLMDYHPEIEARALARRGRTRWLAALVRAVDRFCMRRMDFVIVLDDAMGALVARVAPDVPQINHPTWEHNAGLRHLPVATPAADPGELRLVYCGNLGYAHPLETFEALVRTLSARTAVKLLAVGSSPNGESRFRALAERTGIELTIVPRHPFNDLGTLFTQHRSQVGLVFLSDETAGVVCPSKFTAYVRFGLPTLYVGPPATSTAMVCTRFDAGFAIPNGASQSELEAAATALLDAAQRSARAAHTRDAAEYFGSRSGDTLASEAARFFAA